LNQSSLTRREIYLLCPRALKRTAKLTGRDAARR
jgi:hypothetical protein